MRVDLPMRRTACDLRVRGVRPQAGMRQAVPARRRRCRRRDVPDQGGDPVQYDHRSAYADLDAAKTWLSACHPVSSEQNERTGSAPRPPEWRDVSGTDTGRRGYEHARGQLRRGADRPQSELRREALGSEIGIHEYPGGMIFSAGETPLLYQDDEIGEPPLVYGPVARLLKPLRTKEPWGSWGLPEEECPDWLARFD